MELSDDELSALYGMLSDWAQSSESWTDKDAQHKSSLFERAHGEAKRRKLWWTR